MIVEYLGRRNGKFPLSPGQGKDAEVGGRGLEKKHQRA
jgi:hypothetical protein